METDGGFAAKHQLRRQQRFEELQARPTEWRPPERARCPLAFVRHWAGQSLLGNNPDVSIKHRVAVALQLERAAAGILLLSTGRRPFQLKVLVDRYAVVFDSDLRIFGFLPGFIVFRRSEVD